MQPKNSTAVTGGRKAARDQKTFVRYIGDFKLDAVTGQFTTNLGRIYLTSLWRDDAKARYLWRITRQSDCSGAILRTFTSPQELYSYLRDVCMVPTRLATEICGAEELPGRVIGERFTPGQNDAPEYVS